MKIKTVILILFGLVFLAACGKDDIPPTLAPTASLGQTAGDTAVADTPTVPPTATPIPPTPTPAEPMAALVNGQPLFLTDFEQELARYEQAQAELGGAPEENYQRIVLDALIERMLIQQAAANEGISVTPDMVEQQLADLRQAAEDEAAFAAWLEANHWTEDEFREEIAAGLVSEQMVARVTAGVPTAVEQVRARYIQVDDPALADTLLTQIQNGDDFAFLAQQYSLDTATGSEGGDLGFFARGSLLVPEVEAAAFALQNPGETSGVIAVAGTDGQTTYYLVQLVERDEQRPLPPDMQYTVWEQAFQQWLAQLWQSAAIERFAANE
ncbi:MAG TPA: hypothetical protein EYH05_13670 [Anaerolineae bacterium]|nr:hypothetical protein [Anaerolineae bacterium]